MTEITVNDAGVILVDGVLFDPDVHQVGWQVVDSEGNVVDSGPIVIAEMAGELAETLSPDQGE